MPSAVSLFTHYSVHLDVCWIDQSTSLPSGLLLIYHHTSRWTLPLVTSLKHRKRLLFKQLVMAYHTTHIRFRGST